MKKPIFLFSILIATLLLSSGVSNTSLAHSDEEHAQGTATYSVLGTNTSAVNYWWDSQAMTAYPYTIENETEIVLKIDDIDNINSLINITIGNSTFVDQLDNDATDNLGLGYYALTTKLGFISPTFWDNINTSIYDLGLSSYSFSSTEEFSFGGETYDVVHISFSDGFQSSELIYDKNTGVLYYSDVTIGNYYLNFEITSYITDETDDDHEGDDSETSFNFLIPLIISLSAVVFIRKRNKL